MEHLVDLFTLAQTTRSQPLYGYIMGGVKKNDLSNLAEHHYLVTFIAWQLALNLKHKGASIDIGKVLEFTLVHDFGELLGGDISMLYARKNKKAKELATAFEAENIHYLSKLFGPQAEHFLELANQGHSSDSDEAVISKIADYIEVTHYRLYVEKFSQADIDLITPKAEKFITALQDPIAKKEVVLFFEHWKNNIAKRSIDDILYDTAKQ